VKDINPGPLDSLPEAHYFPGGDFNDLHFFPSGGRAYFSAHSPEAGVELWASDGTTAGTGRVADVNASSNDSSPAEQLPPFSRMLENGVPFNGRTYFAADDGVHGRELWSTDGTAAGTRMEADLVPGAQPSDPTGLLVHENALWFVTVFNRIYKSDGAAAGTTQVSSTLGQVGVISREIKHPLFVYKGKVSFFGAGGDAAHPGAYLWATDGTPAGTVPMGNPITSDTRPTFGRSSSRGSMISTARAWWRAESWRIDRSHDGGVSGSSEASERSRKSETTTRSPRLR